jgi:hypothetical protein
MKQVTPISLKSKVKATDRYRKYLEVLSLFLREPITDVEMQIIDEFYHAESGAITTSSRKTVRENMDVSAEHLNNYIRRLRLKKLMTKDSLIPMLLQPIPEGETMKIHINLAVIL